jgi:uncharacterized alpha-E superfamily protein
MAAVPTMLGVIWQLIVIGALVERRMFVTRRLDMKIGRPRTANSDKHCRENQNQDSLHDAELSLIYQSIAKFILQEKTLLLINDPNPPQPRVVGSTARGVRVVP